MKCDFCREACYAAARRRDVPHDLRCARGNRHTQTDTHDIYIFSRTPRDLKRRDKPLMLLSLGGLSSCYNAAWITAKIPIASLNHPI